MYYMPWWMQWAQALALIVISCLGSWIAFRQARIAAAKLNLDLYDRRFKVFDACRQFARAGLWTVNITEEAIGTFNAATIDAVFLFDAPMVVYLEEFGKKVFQLRLLKGQFDGATIQDARVAIGQELESHGMSVAGELTVLVNKFKPYLKLGNI